jgi:hypothetical protein
MNDLRSQFSSLGFNPGYYDLLIMDRNLSLEPDFNFNFSTLDYNKILNVENLEFTFAQDATNFSRLAGEGADPNNFGLGKADFSASFNMLLKVPSTGYVDFGFANLWDCATLAYKGTGNSASGRILNNNNPVGVGTTFINVDNIADFIGIPTPFTLAFKKLSGTGSTENKTVTNVDKANRRLFFSSGTAYSHVPNETFVWAKPTNPATNREPTFSLVSLFQGLLSGCLVNKLVIDIKPGEDVDINVDLKFTNVDRQYQIDVYENFSSLTSNISKYKVQRATNGSEVRINNTSYTAGGFGLTNAFGHPFFQGFIGLGVTSFLVKEFTITIDNQLEPVYGLHSISNDVHIRRRENLKPYALVSNGRKIEGVIKYLSPIAPWTLAEKLSGPSSINNGGIEVDFGSFKISFPEVVWSGSRSSSPLSDNQTKEIKFSVATEKLENNPVLNFSSSF